MATTPCSNDSDELALEGGPQSNGEGEGEARRQVLTVGTLGDEVGRLEDDCTTANLTCTEQGKRREDQRRRHGSGGSPA